MVSKASDDLPDPERPVKTIRRSRGNSRETSWRLCSRAPRITNRSDTTGGYRRGATDRSGGADRSGSAGRRGGAELDQLVAQECRLLETELGRRPPHLGLHLVDDLDQL